MARADSDSCLNHEARTEYHNPLLLGLHTITPHGGGKSNGACNSAQAGAFWGGGGASAGREGAAGA